MNKLVLILFSLFGFLCYADTVSWKDLQNNIDSWIQGPVGFLLIDQERDVYKKLKSPEEKMQFIKIFWTRRDPILRTRENEFKEEFYRRLDYANQNFGEGSVPGWKTARGQVYIVLGAPQREEKRLLDESSRPALLWVYDKIPSGRIPRNEALLFVYRDFKYVLLPPSAEPGDSFAEAQRELESRLKYQSIPGSVLEAFEEINTTDIVDEKKDYHDLLYSVKSSERFGLAEIQYDLHIGESHPPQIQVSLKTETAPVYDDGDKVFTELLFRQELKKGDVLVASNEHVASFSWDQEAFADQKEIAVNLPLLEAPSGEYELWVTVQDRISGVAQTRKLPMQW